MGTLAISACALTTSAGDHFLAERDFQSARTAYLEVLENRQSGRRVERALYNLSLLYLQPDPALHDPIAAEETLTRLTYIRPRSRLAAQATLLLGLWRQTGALRAKLDDQRARTHEAEQRLSSLRETATASEALSEDQSKVVGRLGTRISGLEGQIAKLREELEATDRELTERERELERLKLIDLEEPR